MASKMQRLLVVCCPRRQFLQVWQRLHWYAAPTAWSLCGCLHSECLQIGTEGTLDLALAANVIILDLYRQHDESAAIIAGRCTAL